MTFFIKNYCIFEEISSRAVPSIFYFFLKPILRFKTFLRKAATKVKNQVFPMIWSSFWLVMLVQNVSTALSGKSDVTRVVIFLSRRKNKKFGSKFWNQLRILIYCADKAGFWMGSTKTQFFVDVPIWESKFSAWGSTRARKRHFSLGSACILNYKPSKILDFSLLSLPCDEIF